MKICAVNSAYTLTRYSKKQYAGNKLYQNLKYDAVCFKSKDFLELSKEEICKKIQESITPENFIGQGTEAEVYRIKGTNYCVRIPYETISAFSRNQDINKLYYNNNILPKEKVNHIKIMLSYGIICGTCKSYSAKLIKLLCTIKTQCIHKKGEYLFKTL